MWIWTHSRRDWQWEHQGSVKVLVDLCIWTGRCKSAKTAKTYIEQLMLIKLNNWDFLIKTVHFFFFSGLLKSSLDLKKRSWSLFCVDFGRTVLQAVGVVCHRGRSNETSSDAPPTELHVNKHTLGMRHRNNGGLSFLPGLMMSIFLLYKPWAEKITTLQHLSACKFMSATYDWVCRKVKATVRSLCRRNWRSAS